jgi:hypothetical protein
MVVLQSDVALVPRDPVPATRPHPVRTVPCPLCCSRQGESHPCKAIGGSDVVLVVNYADSAVSLVRAKTGAEKPAQAP